jgi:hypothetical protein
MIDLTLPRGALSTSSARRADAQAVSPMVEKISDTPNLKIAWASVNETDQ